MDSKPSGEDDIEMGPPHRSRRVAVDDSSDTDHTHTDSLCFSDAEDHSWRQSPHPNGSVPDPSRKSCVSDCSLETDLESGVVEAEINKASPEKWEKNCRICHLSLLEGIDMVLGCSCKDDLAAAHRQCAETWFKIKGNKTCEICGSTATNVTGSSETEFIDQWNESSNNNNNNSNNNNATNLGSNGNESRRFWQGHRFLNFLLACMVFAFVISWLFHFNVPG